MKDSIDGNNRVIVIGLDGATYDLLGPWLEQKKLPNIETFIREGSYGELASTIPPLSPVAWTTSVTGVNPGKHGIFDFLCRQPDSYEMRVMNASMRRTKPVWTLLSEAGKKVGVMNVPMTYPPDEVNGVMVSGMGTPGLNCNFTYPSTLRDEIIKRFGDYYIGLKDVPEDGQEGSYEQKTIQRLCDLVDHRFEVATYLMERERWDFFMVVLMATDTVQHLFWKFIDPAHPLYDKKEARRYGDAIFQIYKKADEKIGRLLKMFGDDTTFIVMSDHGAGPLYRLFFIQKWMASKGYLDVARAGDGVVSKKGAKRLLRNFVLLTKGLLPERLKAILRRRMPGLRHRILASQLMKDINWDKTLAFSEGAAGGIFVNLKGRMPRGTVNHGSDYEDLVNRVTSDLLRIKDPELGQNVVKAIYKAEEIYHGDCLEYAPDLCVSWNDGYAGITGWISIMHDFCCDDENSCFGTLKQHQWTGSHKSNGIIQLKGPHIRNNVKLEGSQIADVTPTILHLLGFEIPEELDGKVLEGAFKDSFIKSHPLRYNSSTNLKVSDMEKGYSKDDAKKVQDELRGLGYIE
jgi:predicted AlkP superfamily phosphohydrolase/phosphomutase